MPGGSDVNPRAYGQAPNNENLYGIDDLQDDQDISIARYALATGLPLLGICRGYQITNVALGGSLIQDMEQPHRHHVATVTLEKYVGELGLAMPSVQASCFHHQALDQLAPGVEAIAYSAEGFVEAVRFPSNGWAFGVQWHPEDNFDSDPAQLQLLERFISEARLY